MYLRPRMTRFGGHAGPYVWGGVTGVTDRDNPWLTAVQQNTATRLVVQAKSYDAEQRFLVNENPLSVRTALGVGLGASGCAGPIFAVDKDGSCVWIDQKLATVDYARIYCTTPSFTDGTIFTVEGVTSTQPTSAATEIVFRFVDVGLDVYGYMFNGRLGYHDDIASTTSATNVQTLLGLNDWDLFAFRFAVSGTSLIVQVRKLSDVSWTNVLSGSTVTAADVNGGVFYLGHNSTGSVRRGKYQNLALRDGDESAVKIAEFTPSMFVGGNRADGDTAVDAYGVTWTIERPAATTDMPRVMVGRAEQYISLPGVSGEYVSTPATAANKITGDFSIKMKVTPDDYTPASTGGFANRWSGASDRSWRCQLFTAGTVLFQHTSDGATTKSAYSTADFTGSYLGVYLDVDNGAGGHDVYFYTSSDGVTWTQLGSTVTTAGTSSVYAGTSALIVGGHNSGASELMPMDFEWMELISGDLNGTLVERIDAAEANPNSTTWTSSTSGATVTVNKSASAQYHATVVPANTTIVQGDGANDFAQVCGDDTITGFVPATGLTLVLDASFSSGAGSGGVFASSANATTDDGLIVSRNSTNPRVQGRLDDGTTVATIGDNANNVTYSDRFQATFAFGSSDHEAFVDGVSVEAATNAVTAETAAGALRFGAEIDGSNPAAFDLYGVAVLGERTSDTEAAAYATEGLTR